MLAWCLPCATRLTAVGKRIGGLLPLNVRIQFHTIVSDILDPVTMNNALQAQHKLKVTDLFMKYVDCILLRDTQAADLTK